MLSGWYHKNDIKIFDYLATGILTGNIWSNLPNISSLRQIFSHTILAQRKNFLRPNIKVIQNIISFFLFFIIGIYRRKSLLWLLFLNKKVEME